MKNPFLIISIVFAVIIISYLSYHFYIGPKFINCYKEGENQGFFSDCCMGLKVIETKENAECASRPTRTNGLPDCFMNVGGRGICTAKCGNGICDNATENKFNCSGDCK